MLFGTIIYLFDIWGNVEHGLFGTTRGHLEFIVLSPQSANRLCKLLNESVASGRHLGLLQALGQGHIGLIEQFQLDHMSIEMLQLQVESIWLELESTHLVVIDTYHVLRRVYILIP